MNFLQKIRYYYLNIGLKKTLTKIISKPFNFYRNKFLEKKILSQKNTDKIFSEIYKTNYWNEKESKSGTGSSLKSTEQIRNEIPNIIKQFEIKTVLDIPCGDFTWFKKIVNNLNVKYIGCDIVNEIILNNKKYENNKLSFFKLDIIEDKLPDADLIICRDCLFHFSYEDIEKTFINLEKSNFKYLLITNHNLNNINLENKDILTGSFRFLDFQKKPFNFKNNHIKEFYDLDFPPVYVEKKMLLFSRMDFLYNIKNYQKNYQKN